MAVHAALGPDALCLDALAPGLHELFRSFRGLETRFFTYPRDAGDSKARLSRIS